MQGSVSAGAQGILEWMLLHPWALLAALLLFGAFPGTTTPLGFPRSELQLCGLQQKHSNVPIPTQTEEGARSTMQTRGKNGEMSHLGFRNAGGSDHINCKRAQTQQELRQC